MPPTKSKPKSAPRRKPEPKDKRTHSEKLTDLAAALPESLVPSVSEARRLIGAIVYHKETGSYDPPATPDEGASE